MAVGRRRRGRRRRRARHDGHRDALTGRRPALQVPAGRVTTPPPPPAVVAAQSASEHRAKVATAQAVDDEVGRRVERDEQVCARWVCARWAR